MSMKDSPGLTNFGLLPEPDGRSVFFVISSTVNTVVLVALILIGMMTRHVIQQHYEMTELFAPSTPPPAEHIKQPPPKLPPPPEPPKIELQPQVRHIEMPKLEPTPKAIQMEARLKMPKINKQPAITLAPQPKAALAAAMPAQNNTAKAKVGQVHLGETFGVTPNPNATRPATVAAIGNPYGGRKGPAVAPYGRVGSAGIGNGTRAGSNYGAAGRVASAGIPGAADRGANSNYGRVASAGIPAPAHAAVAPTRAVASVTTSLEVLSRPPVRYTAEARQLKVQGDVILRVTFLASGQVVVQNVVHGLGHGLDEEARRVAQQIQFRPAMRDGRPVNVTTTVTITFQLA